MISIVYIAIDVLPILKMFHTFCFQPAGNSHIRSAAHNMSRNMWRDKCHKHTHTQLKEREMASEQHSHSPCFVAIFA